MDECLQTCMMIKPLTASLARCLITLEDESNESDILIIF